MIIPRRHNRLRQTLLMLAIVALCLLPFAAITARADADVVVSDSGAENRVPAEIRFKVTAESASQITKVTLRYKMAGGEATVSSSAQFVPGTKAQAEYVWNTQRDYVPPGVDLQYYWQIEDAAGHQVQTAPASLTLDDTRFRWQTLAAGTLTLYWYSGDKGFAEDLLNSGTRASKQLADEVGVTIARPVKILVYGNQRDLLGALPPRGVEWVGGQAFPGARVVVLTANTSPAERDFGARTVAHELTHLVIHAATDNPFGGVPRWLDGGLAMYAEGKLPASFQTALDRAVASDSLLSLRSLTGNFPTDAQASLLGYAESYNIVRYTIASYGRDNMSKLLGIFREGSTPEDAIRSAYGKDLATIEGEWRTSIGAKAIRPALAPSPTTPATPATNASTSPAPVPTQSSKSTASSDKSCLGGLLPIGAMLGGILVLATRSGLR